MHSGNELARNSSQLTPWPKRVRSSEAANRAVTSIIKGRQDITAATALRFGKYFGTPPEYWPQLQHLHDLAAAREEQADAPARIRPLVA